MKRTLPVAAIGLLIGAFACGVITIPNEPSAPMNTCGDNTSCSSRYPDASLPPLCFGGTCVAGSSFLPILVVGVPEGPVSPVPGIAGATFGLPDSYQSVRRNNQPADCVIGGIECDFLPPLAQVLPSLNIRIPKDVGVALWPPGLRPNQPDPPLPQVPLPTSLPVHGVFHPMWIDPATGTPMLARRLGLPLGDRVMAATVAKRTLAGIALVGPTASSATQEGTALGGTVPQPLAPTDPSGKYQLEVVPDSPFDVFPPFVTRGNADANKSDVFENLDVSPGSVTLGGQQFELSSTIPVYYANPPLGQQQVLFNTTYEVDELPGAPSLAGWTMHIDLGEKAPTGVDDDAVRISGVATLPAGATKNVTMWWATGTVDQTNETLFIDPPPGVDLPRYVAPSTAGIIAGTFKYPALPPQAMVSGKVERADTLDAVSARVVFFANGDPTAAVVEADGITPATTLLYEKDVLTDTEDKITASLPPGNLRAYVVPDDPALAITEQPFVIAPLTNVVQNKTLYVNPRPRVTGRVVLSDGTPVYGADVVIDASADDPFSSQDDPLARPRESQSSTDVEGRFDVPSDPGFVDVSIRPHAGTGFPWVVLTHRTVLVSVVGDAGSAGGLQLGDLVVPLPTPFVQSDSTGAIADVSGNLLPFATVRAYAFPPAGSLDAGTSPTRGARLIGSTVADANGVFQLFVTPPQ